MTDRGREDLGEVYWKLEGKEMLKWTLVSADESHLSKLKTTVASGGDDS